MCSSYKYASTKSDKFMKRYEIVNRRKTSALQKLPAQLETQIALFYDLCVRYIRLANYPLVLVGNMNETLVCFDMISNTAFSKKEAKECIIRHSGHEKALVTVVLAVSVIGEVLDPLVIFKSKTDRPIKDLIIRKVVCVKTQEKAQIAEKMVNVWVDKIWFKYVKQNYEELQKFQSIPVYDTFKTHHLDSIQTNLTTDNVVLGGCTSKV